MSRISDILSNAGYPNLAYDIILERYNEKHRHYHTLEHINDMLLYVGDYYEEHKLCPLEIQELELAIIFHDIVCFPLANDNEEKSVELFESLSGHLFEDSIYEISKMIMATKNHETDKYLSSGESLIIRADLHGFNDMGIYDLWDMNMRIFREYAVVDWKDFKKGRVNFLHAYRDKCQKHLGARAYMKCRDVEKMMEAWTPKIAVFPGSFNPFHVGHKNILEKAEKIFDKVVISCLYNPEKKEFNADIPKSMKWTHQVDYYGGLLTDYVKRLGYPVTVIKGLRGTKDLEYEVTQLRYLQDIDKTIDFCYLICDKEYIHVSSSGIKALEVFKKEHSYRIV